MKGNFHILEQQIPMETQMTYFSQALKCKTELADKLPLSDEACEQIYEELLNPENTYEQRQHYLTVLAGSQSIKAYRLLQEYDKLDRDEQTTAWTKLALMDARIQLEASFSNERQIYVTCGMGGKGDKLRYCLLLLSRNLIPLQAYQQQIVERELTYTFQQYDGEVEELRFGPDYALAIILYQFKGNIATPLKRVIEECNQYGNFLNERLFLTNTRIYTEEEINHFKEKYEYAKTSD